MYKITYKDLTTGEVIEYMMEIPTLGLKVGGTIRKETSTMRTLTTRVS